MKRNIMVINGYNIEYTEEGKNNGKTVVFAHGLGGNIEQWNKQIEFFSAKYHVIAFSLPGHGESSNFDENVCYSIEEYSKIIVKFLDELQISSCTWVGNSMGGVLGYHILKIIPEKIEMLITNGTTPELIMSKLTTNLITFFDKLLIKIMKFDGYIKFAANHSSKIQSVQEEIYGIFKKSSPKAIIDSHYMLANYSYIETINNTDVPIVIIKAQYDRDINKYIKKIDKEIQKNKNVRVIEFDSVGHIANLEKPVKYNNIVEKLLEY